jgi:hypothetical protein
LFVGGILLIFGLQWLRKAILRASGFKALRNEEAAFDDSRRDGPPRSPQCSPYSVRLTLRTSPFFWAGDFIVGDDWRVAVGAAIAIALTFVAAHHGANLWWLRPLTVTALLTISVRRATQPEVVAAGDDEV